MKLFTFVAIIVGTFLLASCGGPKTNFRVNHNGAIVLESTAPGKHAISGSAPNASSDYAVFQENMTTGFLWKRYRDLLADEEYVKAKKLRTEILSMEKKNNVSSQSLSSDEEHALYVKKRIKEIKNGKKRGTKRFKAY